jgi:hypothetical protein
MNLRSEKEVPIQTYIVPINLIEVNLNAAERIVHLGIVLVKAQQRQRLIVIAHVDREEKHFIPARIQRLLLDRRARRLALQLKDAVRIREARVVAHGEVATVKEGDLQHVAKRERRLGRLPR